MVIEYEGTRVKRESDVEEVLFMFRRGESLFLLMEQDNREKDRTRLCLLECPVVVRPSVWGYCLKYWHKDLEKVVARRLFSLKR